MPLCYTRYVTNMWGRVASTGEASAGLQVEAPSTLAKPVATTITGKQELALAA